MVHEDVPHAAKYVWNLANFTIILCKETCNTQNSNVFNNLLWGDKILEFLSQ